MEAVVFGMDADTFILDSLREVRPIQQAIDVDGREYLHAKIESGVQGLFWDDQDREYDVRVFWFDPFMRGTSLKPYLPQTFPKDSRLQAAADNSAHEFGARVMLYVNTVMDSPSIPKVVLYKTIRNDALLPLLGGPDRPLVYKLLRQDALKFGLDPYSLSFDPKTTEPMVHVTALQRFPGQKTLRERIDEWGHILAEQRSTKTMKQFRHWVARIITQGLLMLWRLQAQGVQYNDVTVDNIDVRPTDVSELPTVVTFDKGGKIQVDAGGDVVVLNRFDRSVLVPGYHAAETISEIHTLYPLKWAEDPYRQYDPTYNKSLDFGYKREAQEINPLREANMYVQSVWKTVDAMSGQGVWRAWQDSDDRPRAHHDPVSIERFERLTRQDAMACSQDLMQYYKDTKSYSLDDPRRYQHKFLAEFVVEPIAFEPTDRQRDIAQYIDTVATDTKWVQAMREAILEENMKPVRQAETNLKHWLSQHKRGGTLEDTKSYYLDHPLKNRSPEHVQFKELVKRVNDANTKSATLTHEVLERLVANEILNVAITQFYDDHGDGVDDVTPEFHQWIDTKVLPEALERATRNSLASDDSEEEETSITTGPDIPQPFRTRR